MGDWVFASEWKDDPEYQDWGSCPNCGLGVVDGADCTDCGTPYATADLHDGLCPGCYVDRMAAESKQDNARNALWSFVDDLFWGTK